MLAIVTCQYYFDTVVSKAFIVGVVFLKKTLAKCKTSKM